MNLPALKGGYLGIGKLGDKMEICQSCGMPLKQDPQGGGTNADGGKSKKYCSYCYQNGEFVGGEMTVEEFQEFCRKKMIESGMSKFIAWFFSRGLKRLERWKKTSAA